MSGVARGRGVCPQAVHHAWQPEGYLQWHAWAERKSRTHRQLRCAGCGRYEIWVPKQARGAAERG